MGSIQSRTILRTTSESLSETTDRSTRCISTRIILMLSFSAHIVGGTQSMPSLFVRISETRGMSTSYLIRRCRARRMLLRLLLSTGEQLEPPMLPRRQQIIDEILIFIQFNANRGDRLVFEFSFNNKFENYCIQPRT